MQHPCAHNHYVHTRSRALYSRCSCVFVANRKFKIEEVEKQGIEFLRGEGPAFLDQWTLACQLPGPNKFGQLTNERMACIWTPLELTIHDTFFFIITFQPKFFHIFCFRSFFFIWLPIPLIEESIQKSCSFQIWLLFRSMLH